MPDDQVPRPRPTLEDWLLLVISIVFVVAGLIILPKNRDAGIVTIAFFGSCLMVFANIIVRKLRYRRLTFEQVDVPGGVPIRQSRRMMVLYGGWLASLGTILVAFGGGYPLVFRLLGLFVALVGFVVLVLAIWNVWHRRMLQFDPDALCIGESRWVARIPWDAIAAVEEYDYQNNPILLVHVPDLTAVEIVPGEAQPRALRAITRARSLMGAEFSIFVQHFEVDRPVLAAAIATFAKDAEARTQLRRRLPGSEG